MTTAQQARAEQLWVRRPRTSRKLIGCWMSYGLWLRFSICTHPSRLDGWTDFLKACKWPVACSPSPTCSELTIPGLGSSPCETQWLLTVESHPSSKTSQVLHSFLQAVSTQKQILWLVNHLLNGRFHQWIHHSALFLLLCGPIQHCVRAYFSFLKWKRENTRNSKILASQDGGFLRGWRQVSLVQRMLRSELSLQVQFSSGSRPFQ